MEDQEMDFEEMMQLEEEAEEAWQQYPEEPIETPQMSQQQDEEEEKEATELERKFWDEGGFIPWAELSRILVASAEEVAGRGKLGKLGAPYCDRDIDHIERTEMQIA
eukprot:7085255-Pyramimonas_sp.AAC.1